MGRLRVRRWYLLVLTDALALASTRTAVSDQPHALAVTRVLVLAKVGGVVALVLSNWSGRARLVRLGLGLVLLGSLSNAVPVLVYGSMPYALSSARAAGMADRHVTTGRPGHLGVVDLATASWPLSDVVPVPALHTVLSVGDLVLLAGLLLIGLGASRPAARRVGPAAADEGLPRRRPLPSRRPGKTSSPAHGRLGGLRSTQDVIPPRFADHPARCRRAAGSPTRCTGRGEEMAETRSARLRRAATVAAAVTAPLLALYAFAAPYVAH